MTIKNVCLSLLTWATLLAIVLLAIVSPIIAAADRQQNVAWTAEDVRFAEKRCINDSSSASENLKILWRKRKYPNQHETHCYIKCFLNKLGLIDLNSRGLAADKFFLLLDNIGTKFDEGCLEQTDFDERLDGTCYSYYTKWNLIFSKCPELMKYVMYDDRSNVAYRYLPHSKSIGETATEFCDSTPMDNNVGAEVTYESGEDDNLSFMSAYKCSLECIFKRFRYFDAYGRLDKSEIVRSFDEAHLLTPQNVATIQTCTHLANSFYAFGYCEMAYNLKNCLTKLSKDYLNVYIIRNKLTKYY